MKKRKIAAAIGYSTEDVAPRVLASGKGKVAEQIVAIAGQEGITIVEDSALAALLEAETLPGDLIPVWCWEAVAKILAFVRQDLCVNSRNGTNLPIMK